MSRPPERQRCEYCRHWGELAFNQNAPRQAAWRLCNQIGEDHGIDPVWEGAGGIATAPSFGCVNFAKNEGGKQP